MNCDKIALTIVVARVMQDGQDVYAWVPWHCVQVHVARYGGGREWLAQGRGARSGAGRVLVLTTGVVDAVWGDVDGRGLTAHCSLWGWMWLRRATARVLERPSLINTAPARDALGSGSP